MAPLRCDFTHVAIVNHRTAISKIGVRDRQGLPSAAFHPRIMKAHEDFLPQSQLQSQLAHLRNAMDDNDVGRIP
ncbi:MAG TPA: hypothetical protein VGK09_06845 [Rhodocyclaceae bacterium]|jgi:SET domain-containing protein